MQDGSNPMGAQPAEAPGPGVVRGDDGLVRCAWGSSTPEYVAYHDREWGRPVLDDVHLYEKLCLEGFQSGLSWLTILRKREGFRRAFAGFDPSVVAGYGADDVDRLLADASIVRHRGKIEATIANARATLAVQAELGSLAALVWSFEPPRPAAAALPGEIPSATPESSALSSRAAPPGVPLHRAHHRVCRDAVAGPGRRPPGRLSRARRVRGRSTPGLAARAARARLIGTGLIGPRRLSRG